MTLRIIAGKFKGRQLKIPKTNTTRPTSSILREALFNICQFEIANAKVLDLYAGSGAIGFEALSRGAAHVTFVEKNKQASECIRENIALLQVASQITLLPLDAISSLKKMKQPFDLIYIDPPYDTPIFPIVKEIILQNLLKPSSFLFIEERYDPDRKENPTEIPDLKHISSRKFGIALLHQYQKNTPAEKPG